eukprot:501606-Rhodomonas_salina.4
MFDGSKRRRRFRGVGAPVDPPRSAWARRPRWSSDCVPQVAAFLHRRHNLLDFLLAASRCLQNLVAERVGQAEADNGEDRSRAIQCRDCLRAPRNRDRWDSHRLAVCPVLVVRECIPPPRSAESVAWVAGFCAQRRDSSALLLAIHLVSNLVEMQTHSLVLNCTKGAQSVFAQTRQDRSHTLDRGISDSRCVGYPMGQSRTRTSSPAASDRVRKQACEDRKH